MSQAQEAVIARYVESQAARDFDGLLALFTPDAVVVDEGRSWRGAKQIRAWRDGVASAYEYTTELKSIDVGGAGRYVAHIHLEGNFPGGMVDLEYSFTFDGNRIRRLEIDERTCWRGLPRRLKQANLVEQVCGDEVEGLKALFGAAQLCTSRRIGGCEIYPSQVLSTTRL